MADSRLDALAARGQSVWIDLLSRDFVRSGELQRMIDEDAVTGLTSNPSIFQKAIAAGDGYDDQIRELVSVEPDPRRLFFQLAITDVRSACDVLRPTWERTGGHDGYVSLEVDPGLADDADGTFAQAVELHEAVGRPNVYIKIPATVAGLSAIEDSIAHGISVNVTLIFSLERYRAVTAAYLRGLSRLVFGDRGDASGVSSVASFFVSRVDTETDRRLEEHGNTALQGRLGIANAKLAYKHFQETFTGPIWDRLAAAGASRQRPLWASTSTKNPAYRDVIYVEELVGPDTVNTMPPETLVAFQDHGEVRGDTLLDGVAEAEQLLADLATAGIDYDDVVTVLEVEGVKKFADAFDELIDGLQARRGELTAT